MPQMGSLLVARRRRLLLIHLWMLPSVAGSPSFCAHLKAHNVSRLVLSGDSIIGGMAKVLPNRRGPFALRSRTSAQCNLHGKSVACIGPYGSPDGNNGQCFKQCTTARGCRLTYFDRYFVCPRPEVEVVHIGQFDNASCIEQILIHDLQRPLRSRDMLVVLHGAHSRVTPTGIAEFHSFVTEFAEHVASPFPGVVFWFEPLPQHFNNGAYSDTSQNNGINCSAPAREPQSQYMRTLVVRTAVLQAKAPRVHVVPAFDSLVYTAHRMHPQRGDCTHYVTRVYEELWERLATLAHFWAPADYDTSRKSRSSSEQDLIR